MEEKLVNIDLTSFNEHFVDSIKLELLTKDELIKLSDELKKKKIQLDVLVLDDEYVGNSYNNIDKLKTKCKSLLNK